jgi:hydrogenase maturation protein HypF
LLADGFGSPLVATSANLSGEPVLTDGDEVERRLAKVADAFLHHNRPIRRPADDSVFRLIAGKPRPMRLGRGNAPLERKLPFRLEQPLLAVGADLKNTVALAFGDRVVISPHIGELGSVRSAEVFKQVVADLVRLYGVSPAAIICDAHPGYHSSRWAKKQSLPVIPVFHHHAHASALAGEHGLADQVLVFTWDDTGYGEDGTMWGGEAFLGSPGNWRRMGSLRPFCLPGGDKASREPWRCALSLCWEQGINWQDCPGDMELLRLAWEQRINCPVTSSAGRLFDSAAALIGVASSSTYEGHAAMRLEAIAEMGAKAITLPLTQNPAGILVSDWSPLLPFLMNAEISPIERSSVFHASLAATIVTQAKAIRVQSGVTRVGLSGCVFQNRLLTEQALSALENHGFEVYLHENIPAGDGGISYGQIIEAESRMR